jgi:hypothetical protein
LILCLPLSKIIPLLVLLDFVAAFGNWLPAVATWQAGAVALAAVHGDGLHPRRGVLLNLQIGPVAAVDGPVSSAPMPSTAWR